MDHMLEAERKSSTHGGMVFGHYCSDADDRPARIVGWNVIRDGRIVSRFRTKREAQAFITRRNATDAVDPMRFLAAHCARRSA